MGKKIRKPSEERLNPIYSLSEKEICDAYRYVAKEFNLNLIAWKDVTPTIFKMLGIEHNQQNTEILQKRASRIRQEVGEEECPVIKNAGDSMSQRDGIKMLYELFDKEHNTILYNASVHYMIPKDDYIQIKSAIGSMKKRKPRKRVRDNSKYKKQ